MVRTIWALLCLTASIAVGCGGDSANPRVLDASSNPACVPGAWPAPGCPADFDAAVAADAETLDGAGHGAVSDGGSVNGPGAPAPGTGTDGAVVVPAPIGEVGPCVRNDAPGRVYNLCVWTTQADLDRIHADPNARIEIPASVSLNGQLYQGAEFEIHGGSGRLWPKKSYRVRFREKPRPSYDFFGAGEQKIERLVLQAAHIDPTFVRNKVIFDTLTEIGALAPRLGYAHVYINGALNGLYQIIERVDEHFLERYGFDPTGNLYKADTESADFRIRDPLLTGWKEGTNEDGVAEDLAELFRAVFETERSYPAYQSAIETRIDLNDFHLFHMVMSHALNLDGFVKNYYLFHDPAAVDPAHGAIFRVIHWDADATYGNDWNTHRAPDPGRVALWGQVENETPDNDLALRMYDIPEYRAAYLARFDELLRGPLSAAALRAKAEPLLTALEADIRADLARWQPVELSFDEERAFLLQMFDLRTQVLSAAVAQARAQP